MTDVEGRAWMREALRLADENRELRRILLGVGVHWCGRRGRCGIGGEEWREG
jgi:hypothetical protein